MLKGKTILIIGIRNKWSIAYGIAEAVKRQNGNIIFIYRDGNSNEKIEKVIQGFNAKIYKVKNIVDDKEVKELFKKIKKDCGKVDGVVHAVAHANTEDLHNDFIYTSKEGFLHALEVSTYSFVSTSRIAKEVSLLNKKSSLVTLTYLGSERVLRGYNVMGVAKAALESATRYLSENLGKEEIRVNALSAGPINTLSARGIKNFNTILDIVEKKSPLHKNVTIKQVGNVAAFLLSDLSDSITGQVIYADNGYNIIGE
ncbi:MAG: SDR family oxidoreductase [Mollicutes bacterium]|nr:SDR family oxidoreductase [Mollicutes bacterium]